MPAGDINASGTQVRLGDCALSTLVANSVEGGLIHLARGVFVPDPSGTPASAISGPCTLGLIAFHAKGVAATGGAPLPFVGQHPAPPFPAGAYNGERLQTATVDGLVRV